MSDWDNVQVEIFFVGVGGVGVGGQLSVKGTRTDTTNQHQPGSRRLQDKYLQGGPVEYTQSYTEGTGPNYHHYQAIAADKHQVSSAACPQLSPPPRQVAVQHLQP